MFHCQICSCLSQVSVIRGIHLPHWVSSLTHRNKRYIFERHFVCFSHLTLNFPANIVSRVTILGKMKSSADPTVFIVTQPSTTVREANRF